ncbi:MAG TPA: hypothetical protein PKH07_20100, partial [bacterium]|nr:hypothetical protein [bacterium]
ADATGKAPDTLLMQLDTQLQAQLSQTKKIPLVERADDRYLDELFFGTKDGWVDPERIPKTGKLVGAKYYLSTLVTKYSASAWGDNAALPNVYENSWSVSVEVTGKVINVETGQLLETILVTESSSGKSEDKEKMTSVPNLNGILGSLAQKATGEIVDQLLVILFPALIADVSETEIFLNQGEATGVKVGDRYTVFSQGKAIVDPQTGRTLGNREQKIGDIEIVEVRREYSTAKSADVALSEFAPGMVCRPVTGAKKSEPVVKDSQPSVSSSGATSLGDTPKTSKPKEETAPKEPKGRVFCLAEMLNSTSAPRRVEQAIHGYLSGMIRQAKDVTLVTRSERELMEIGQEFLRSKSRLMDKETALKTV